MIIKNSEAQKQSSEKFIMWNKWLGVLFFAQGCLILLLGAPKTFPISVSYMATDPLQTTNSGHAVLATATHHMFDLNITLVVVAFLFVAAIAHFFVATGYKKQYLRGLKQNVNRVRWLDYALSASLMLIVIGILSGIYDLTTLILIFVFSIIAHLLGLAIEVYNRGKSEPNWLAVIGGIAGVMPWLTFFIYACSAGVYGGHIPGFLYAIYASMLALLACFVMNMYLQFQKRGRWANYLYGEKIYMILNLATKTALAWQVFAGVLRP